MAYIPVVTVPSVILWCSVTLLQTHVRVRFPIKSFFNCCSQNVIYLIKCPCGLGYMGKTNREGRVCIVEHRSSIRELHFSLSVAKYFWSAGHRGSQLRFTVMEGVNTPKRGGNLVRLMLEWELFWINWAHFPPKGRMRERIYRYLCDLCAHGQVCSPQCEVVKEMFFCFFRWLFMLRGSSSSKYFCLGFKIHFPTLLFILIYKGLIDLRV